MYSLYYVDYPDNWIYHIESEMIKLKYVGADCIYMAIEIIVYSLLLIFFENIKRICKCCYNPKTNQINNLKENIIDNVVLKEIEKSNRDDIERLNYAIVVQNLTKYFNKNFFCNNEKTITKAVRNLSFCLEYGECFGFLGVNGAGKTTTFKCLSNEYTPSYGRILIDNKELNSNFNTIRSLIGYCPQFDSIFEYMTVKENLEFYSKIKGMKLDKMNDIINALLIEMNLYEYKDKISGQLLGGNKRKLSVSIAMICNPPIILLDEPSTGMDPEARRFMWNVIHKISIRKKKFYYYNNSFYGGSRNFMSKNWNYG